MNKVKMSCVFSSRITLTNSGADLCFMNRALFQHYLFNNKMQFQRTGIHRLMEQGGGACKPGTCMT
jgi:hypothetical protein